MPSDPLLRRAVTALERGHDLCEMSSLLLEWTQLAAVWREVTYVMLENDPLQIIDVELLSAFPTLQ